jgi:hypothetical protein
MPSHIGLRTFRADSHFWSYKMVQPNFVLHSIINIIVQQPILITKHEGRSPRMIPASNVLTRCKIYKNGFAEIAGSHDSFILPLDDFERHRKNEYIRIIAS